METKEATRAGKFNFVYRLSIYFFITKLISISIQIIDDELTRLSTSTSESAREKYFSIKICFSGNEARKKMEIRHVCDNDEASTDAEWMHNEVNIAHLVFEQPSIGFNERWNRNAKSIFFKIQFIIWYNCGNGSFNFIWCARFLLEQHDCNFMSFTKFCIEKTKIYLTSLTAHIKLKYFPH